MTATDTRKKAVDLDDTSNMLLTMLGKEEQGALARRLWKRRIAAQGLISDAAAKTTDLEQTAKRRVGLWM